MQPTENKEYKLIDWRLSDPANFSLFGSKNNKAVFTELHCSNSENCDAYKQGRCAMWKIFGRKCPYGRIYKEEGFTRRARRYSSWISERRKKVEGIAQLSSQDKACRVGEYIYFPYPHWSLDGSVGVNKRAGLFTSHDEFFKEEDFTIEFFESIVNAIPRAIFDNREIKSYQKEVVPLMVQHMKEAFPEFCKEWAQKYPDTAAKFKEVDHTGRTALVRTLKPGCTFKADNKEFHWDGEFVSMDSNNFGILFPIRGTFTDIRMKPGESAKVKITDNSQVCESTVFVD